MALLRGLVVITFWACLVMWLAHLGWLGRLVAPWHPYVPFVFWTALGTLAATESWGVGAAPVQPAQKENAVPDP